MRCTANNLAFGQKKKGGRLRDRPWLIENLGVLEKTAYLSG